MSTTIEEVNYLFGKLYLSTLTEESFKKYYTDDTNIKDEVKPDKEVQEFCRNSKYKSDTIARKIFWFNWIKYKHIPSLNTYSYFIKNGYII